MALTFLIMHSMIEPHNFESAVLDQVLDHGDYLYRFITDTYHGANDQLPLGHDQIPGHLHIFEHDVSVQVLHTFHGNVAMPEDFNTAFSSFSNALISSF